jgi:hypothetical protein
MRIADLKGVDVENRNAMIERIDAERAKTAAEAQAQGMHVVGAVN